MKLEDFPPKLQASLQRLARERAGSLRFGYLLDQKRGRFSFAGGHGIGDSLMKALAWQETGNWGRYSENHHREIGRDLFGLSAAQSLQFRAADMGLDGCDDELWQELCRLFGKDPGKKGPLNLPWKPEDGLQLWLRQEEKVQKEGRATAPIYEAWLPHALRHHRGGAERQPAMER